MTSLDQRKVIDYEEVQDQMKAIYRRLKKANKSKMEIFMEISNKVHGVTLSGCRRNWRGRKTPYGCRFFE